MNNVSQWLRNTSSVYCLSIFCLFNWFSAELWKTSSLFHCCGLSTLPFFKVLFYNQAKSGLVSYSVSFSFGFIGNYRKLVENRFRKLCVLTSIFFLSILEQAENSNMQLLFLICRIGQFVFKPESSAFSHYYLCSNGQMIKYLRLRENNQTKTFCFQKSNLQPHQLFVIVCMRSYLLFMFSQCSLLKRLWNKLKEGERRGL